MRVLGEYVLIEQTTVSKQGKIILDAAKNERDKFEYTFKVIQLGSKYDTNEGIKVGEIPIFSEHMHFSGIKVIEKTATKMISHVIVHGGDIIGVDDDIPEASATNN